jgi:hypothetical protein
MGWLNSMTKHSGELRIEKYSGIQRFLLGERALT